MAYVGTPSLLGNARTTLASIIQGEAGGEGVIGMQAVAQVISNRANQNFGGYGSDLVSQATARNQFQGQSSSISPQAYSVADQALSGSLPNVVGSGAVNYANPSASTARWATNLNSDNAYQLGNHYFTDNTKGAPYSPDLTSNGNVSSSTQSTIPSSTSTPMGDYSNYGGVETSAGSEITSFQPSADGSTGDVTLGFPSDTASSVPTLGAGSFAGSLNVSGGLGATDTSVTANPPSVSDGSQYSLSGAALDSGTTAGSVTGSGDDIAGYNAAGPVVANPALVGATNSVAAQTGQVASATTKGDSAIQSGITTAGQTIAKALGVDTQSWIQWLSDSFLRLAFIVAGLVLFAAALYYFARPQIDSTVAAVAKKVPKVIPV